jgi:hypothetical protein
MTDDEIDFVLALLEGAGLVRILDGAKQRAQVMAWRMGLNGLNYRDVGQATERLIQAASSSRQFQVRPADVREEVKRIRNARLAAVPPPLPDVDPDHVAAYQGRRREQLGAIADGRPIPKMISHPTTTARSDS